MLAESNPTLRAPSAVAGAAAARRADGGARVAAPRGDGGHGVGDADPARQRAWLDVDLGALVRNARRVRDHAGAPLLPMVKADAYGLGAVAAARALDAVDPWGFGVATVPEGEALRAAGITRPIVIFTPILASELPRAHRAGLTPSLHRADDVRAWAAAGGGAWHLSIDTGMHRQGVRDDALDDLVDVLRAHPPEGAYTHFHSADTDDASRRAQEARFAAALARLPARPPVCHAENSPGVERAGASRWDVVRPGIFLYGVSCAGVLAPEPVAHVRARVVDLREIAPGEGVSYDLTWRADAPRRIATLAVGYADGYRRALSSRGVVLLHGRRAPVVGRVTMDMTMCDVTDVPCAIGDVATLLGRDHDAPAGGDVLTVSDVAARGALSPYELLTGLSPRLPRVHHAA